MLLGVFVHSLTTIRNAEQHKLLRVEASASDIGIIVADARCFDFEHSAIGHCISGVETEIQENLLQLAAVSGDVPELLLLHDLDENVLTDQASQHRLHAPNYRVQVYDARR